MDKRLKRMSGAAGRKARKEKEEAVLKKVRRMETFYKPIEKPESDTTGNVSSVLLSTSLELPSTSAATIPSPSATVVLKHQLQPEVDQLEREELQGNILDRGDQRDELEKSSCAVSNDPAEWVINDATIDYLISRGSIDQNLNADFPETKKFFPTQKKFRSLTRNMFLRELQNGEKQPNILQSVEIQAVEELHIFLLKYVTNLFH
ncbi:uncharacterized protein LOC116163768 isoform X2 [Photinus pyralis]|uniref:uncharacterized protein LOC116163768 isoform X2 n=1 Tax=Photinus pyralis TaxID=7054 RepID=UPI0012674FEF|nr:uncharacterized protein LOC116163768 isoform X2 [Photinus pyralis]